VNAHEVTVILRRRWVVFLTALLVALSCGALVSLLQPPTYAATSKVFVSTVSASNVSDLSQSSNYSQQIVNSYADIVSTPIVLDRVVRQLRLQGNGEELSNHVNAAAATNTSVLRQLPIPSLQISQLWRRACRRVRMPGRRCESRQSKWLMHRIRRPSLDQYRICFSHYSLGSQQGLLPWPCASPSTHAYTPLASSAR
jgi:hypothetical protein